MKYFIDKLIEWWPMLILILSCFFEVSKIPINPVSWVGDLLFKNANKRFDDIEKHMNEIDNKIDEEKKERKEEVIKRDKSDAKKRMKQIRWLILDFANSCKNNREHTQDEYLHIIDIYSEYEDIVKTYNFDNGVIETEYEYIHALYIELKRQNKFL